MKKIMFLLTCLDYGGAEIQVIRLAKKLAERGMKIQVVVLIEPVAFVEELNSINIDVKSLNMSRGKADFRAIFKLSLMIKDFKPDVVHSHMVHANILSRVSRIICRMSVLINTIHGIEEVKGKRALLYKLTSGIPDLTTVISKETEKFILNSGASTKNKLKVMFNGVDTALFQYDAKIRRSLREELNITDDLFVWVSVGRFEVPKDHNNLIRAYQQVINEKKKTKLLLIGHGSLKDSIESLTNKLGISAYVEFLGVQNNINQWLSAADGYVMSSEWEGMPLVLQEAASVGLPIVSTNVGGNKEVVIQEKNGYLVPRKSPIELAKAMIELMNQNEKTLKDYSEYSKELVRTKYDIEAVIDQWINLYRIKDK